MPKQIAASARFFFSVLKSTLASLVIAILADARARSKRISSKRARAPPNARARSDVLITLKRIRLGAPKAVFATKIAMKSFILLVIQKV